MFETLEKRRLFSAGGAELEAATTTTTAMSPTYPKPSAAYFVDLDHTTTSNSASAPRLASDSTSR